MASQPQNAVPVPAPSSKTFGSRGGIMAGGRQQSKSSEPPRTGQKVYWLNPDPPVAASGLRRSDTSTKMRAPLRMVRPQGQTPLTMVPPQRQVPAPKIRHQQSAVAASAAYFQQPADSSDSSYTESSSTSTSTTSSFEGASLKTLYPAALRAYRQASTSVGTETTDLNQRSSTKLRLFVVTAIILTIAVTTLINFRLMAGDSYSGEKEREELQPKQASHCNCNDTSPGSTAAAPTGTSNISDLGEAALIGAADQRWKPPSATAITSARDISEADDNLRALKDLSAEDGSGSNGVVRPLDRHSSKKRRSGMKAFGGTLQRRTSPFPRGSRKTLSVKRRANDGVETGRQDPTVEWVAPDQVEADASARSSRTVADGEPW